MIAETIDQNTFERVVSSATNADSQVFDKVQPHFLEVEQDLKVSLLGPLYDDLSVVPGLKENVIKLICLRAYDEQIPHLDLVLTPTGFGIVSNQNVAPASADRVKNLRQQVHNSYEDLFDHVLDLLVGEETWADSTQARICIVNFIYTAKMLRRYYDVPNAHRTELEELHTRIYTAEEKIRENISAEFCDYLLDKVRHNDMTRKEGYIIDLICRFTGFCLAKLWHSAKSTLSSIINYTEKNADEFEAYKNSEAYKVKHFSCYKNDQSDTTYFFG